VQVSEIIIAEKEVESFCLSYLTTGLEKRLVAILLLLGRTLKLVASRGKCGIVAR